MATSLACRNPSRLQLVRDFGALNAIEHLVVVDAGAPSALRQRLLLVHCVRPFPAGLLAGADVRVGGGVRVVDPAVRWAVRLADVDASVDATLPAAAVDHLLALRDGEPQSDAVLVVLVAEPGDHSTYELALRSGGGVPPGFDSQLSAIPFSFKVDCPSPFDCAPGTAPAVAPVDEPDLDYLARDFASFRRLMFDRLELLAPGDSEPEPAGLQATLVEAVAAVADELAYFQDAVATEAYLGTARTRPSVRRHARQLDYPMHDGCNARTVVHVRVGEGVRLEDRPIADGARLLTRVPSLGDVIDPGEVAQAIAAGGLAFEVLRGPATIADVHNAIGLHTWGDEDCTLPAGATEAHLAGADLDLRRGELLLLEQTHAPDTLQQADADPEERHVVRLEEVGPAQLDPLVGGGVVVRRVRWRAEDALRRPLRVTVGTRPVAVALGNLLLVDQGMTVADEPVALEPWGSQGRVRATLSRRGLTWAEPLAEEGSAADTAGAARLLGQDVRRARAAVRLAGEGEAWEPVPDLVSAPPSARAFVVEMETDGRARLRFGTGTAGRRPAPAQPFHATYRVGNGPAGNVGAEAVGHLVADVGLVDPAVVDAVDGVRNPVPARGGRAPEPLEDVRRYAPEAFRVQERAVTEADWAEVAARHPQVQRAVARRRWTGSWHTVFVAVDPVAGTSFEALRDDLVRWLPRYRMAGYDLQVVPPQHVSLDIRLTVCVHVDRFAEQVQVALLAEFSTGLLPDGRRGFFHPDAFTFGQSVWLSQVVARCMDVPGVRWVDATPRPGGNRFKPWGTPQGKEVELGRIRMDDLQVARCDNDPSAPDRGRIAFIMEGGA